LLKNIPQGLKPCYFLSCICGTTEEAAEKVGVSGEIGKKHPSGAKALLCYESFTARLKSCPFKTMCFSAASKVVPFQNNVLFRSL
jgi:hypothetical protein